MAGKNVATGEVYGSAALSLLELVDVAGAEMAEDQMYTTRGMIEADLSTTLNPKTAGAVHMSVKF